MAIADAIAAVTGVVALAVAAAWLLVAGDTQLVALFSDRLLLLLPLLAAASWLALRFESVTAVAGAELVGVDVTAEVVSECGEMNELSFSNDIG